MARGESWTPSSHARGLAAQVGPPVEKGNEATLEVLVHTAGDETIGFTWVLGRQLDPPYAGCWMTDGVLRHPDRAGR